MVGVTSKILLLLISQTSSFTVPFGTRSTTYTSLKAHADSSSLIDIALAASKKYGAASVEARLAWEDVEEVDSADNSAASVKGLDEDCSFGEGDDPACAEYAMKMESFYEMLKENGPKLEQMKNLATEIKGIQMVVPESKISPDSPALQAALADAQEWVKKKGADSTEAKLAWETVEEIASSDNSAATQNSLYDECLTEAIDACESLDELSKVIYQDKNGGDRFSG